LKDIIMKLLDRNQSTRLGTNGDATEIMAHPFFNGINWDDLYNRRIDAPYKPLVNEEQKEGE